MDPNSSMPPQNPVDQPIPGTNPPAPQPMQAPVPEMPQQAAPMSPNPEMAPPQNPQPMAVPMPQYMPPQPVAPQPQPMFTPMTGPVPGQQMPMQPMGPMQPAFTPMAASQMPAPKNKKKLFIIGGIVLVIVILGVVAGLVLSKSALIGSLTSDSYEGVSFERPAAWVKDTSQNNVISYHPKSAYGKSSGSKPTYALFMDIKAQKDVFQSTPNDLSARDKALLQKYIDEEIDKASNDILPSKYDVGCGENPVFKEKPKKIDIKDSFLAIKYSFTCKSGSGSSATTFYFSVVDVVPNNKDIEYLIDMRAASEAIYNKNLTKIDQILSTIKF